MVSENEMTAPPARCERCSTTDDVEWSDGQHRCANCAARDGLPINDIEDLADRVANALRTGRLLGLPNCGLAIVLALATDPRRWSTVELAEETGYDTSTIRQAMRLVEDQGFLRVIAAKPLRAQCTAKGAKLVMMVLNNEKP